MTKNDLIYLFAFVIYIVLCLFRCRCLVCCPNRHDNDVVEYEEGSSGHNSKGQRLDLIKSRLITKKAENASDFSIHRCFETKDSVEIEEGSEKIEQSDASDESIFKTLASSFRSMTSTQEVDSRRQCHICIDEYQIEDDICSSPNKECNHKFHVECMTEWLVKHNNCPLCRADYLKISNEEQNTDDNNLESATGAPQSTLDVPVTSSVMSESGTSQTVQV